MPSGDALSRKAVDSLHSGFWCPTVTLMRFWWQLSMPYQEVSMEELSRNVGEPKLDVLKQLVSAIRTSHDEIDTWIDTVERTFSVVQDRGHEAVGEQLRLMREEAAPASDGPETAREQ